MEISLFRVTEWAYASPLWHWAYGVGTLDRQHLETNMPSVEIKPTVDNQNIYLSRIVKR